MPLQVPAKDTFCRELKEAVGNDQQQRQKRAEEETHSLTLSKLAHSLAEPVKARLGGRKAFASRPAARRLTQETDAPNGQSLTAFAVAGISRAVTESSWCERCPQEKGRSSCEQCPLWTHVRCLHTAPAESVSLVEGVLDCRVCLPSEERAPDVCSYICRRWHHGRYPGRRDNDYELRRHNCNSDCCQHKQPGPA